jgi:uridine phosphorylase
MTLQYHIKAREGDIAPYVLLTGDPGRVKIIASTWDEYRLIATNREYTTCTGTYKGIPITSTSTGIGAPSTAIAIEELARLGAKTFLRLGTCGAFQDYVQNNDIVIFDSAARYDGASVLYAPIEYPAAAHYEVVNACIAAAKAHKVPYHVGTSRSADTFYARHPKPGSSFNDYWQSNWQHHFEDLKRLNITASEMETGIILVLARIWGLRAGSMAVVLDNVFKVMEDTDQFDPETALEHNSDSIETLALLGSEAIRLVYEIDQGN